MLKFPPEGLYEPPAESPKLQRERFFAAAAELMLAMAEGAPLLLCMEDLHWADPTTLEFAASLVGRIAAQPVMLLATCRPDAGLALAEDRRVRVVTLDGLPVGAVEAIVGRITGGLPMPAGPGRADLAAVGRQPAVRGGADQDAARVAPAPRGERAFGSERLADADRGAGDAAGFADGAPRPAGGGEGAGADRRHHRARVQPRSDDRRLPASRARR